MKITQEFTSDFFVIRTPLYPFDEFQRFSEGLTSSLFPDDPTGLQTAYCADRAVMRERLREIFSRKEVQEALWLASPELSQQLQQWREAPSGKKSERMERTLYRYFSRMSTRPTPFGLFSGCSVGLIGADTVLHLDSLSAYRRRTRLDMEFLCNLAEKIVANPGLRRELRFTPNTSLYQAAGRYHFARARFHGPNRKYYLMAVDDSPYLAATLERATQGCTPKELAAALIEQDPEISQDEAESYVTELIGAQILVAEMTPTVSGPNPIDELMDRLNYLPDGGGSTTTLTNIKTHLQQLDTQGMGADLAIYQKVVDDVTSLAVPFRIDHLLQVDMIKPAASARLGEQVLRTILQGVDFLHSIQPPPVFPGLESFRQRFEERYQQQELPLAEVLDEEIGIGFERSETSFADAEPLLQGIPVQAGSHSAEAQWRHRDTILLAKLEYALNNNLSSLTLDETDVKGLQTGNGFPLPDAFSVMVDLARSPDSEAEDRYSFFIRGGSGPSGANLLGRFCDADETLSNHVHSHIRAEEASNPTVIFAEVVHLPQGRLGNVLFRPSLRQYEIPFLGASRLPREFQIPVTDLLVSVRNGRIVLRSQRLGAEVMPRLTNAHGYFGNGNLRLYKFLCSLQNQGTTSGLGWSWGALERASFLPRVSFGRQILARAKWRVSRAEIERLSRESGPACFREVKQWQQARKIPRFVLLADMDNELLVDLDNALAIETFVQYVKKRNEVVLIEEWPGIEGLCLTGPEGRFVHQLLLPFHRKSRMQAGEAWSSAGQRKPQEQNHAKPMGFAVNQVQPTREIKYLPGSEWIFAKLYASPYHIDWLLLNVIKPLVERVLSEGIADRWFFLRYADPEWHLRLRFRGHPRRLLAELLPVLHESVSQEIRTGRVWRCQLDTYEPEVARYGGSAGLSLAEEIFCYDSEAALETIGILGGDAGMETRWKAALYGVDDLLSSLGFDLAGKCRFAEMRDHAHRGDLQPIERQVSDRFRKERPALEAILNSTKRGSGLPDGIVQACVRRSLGITPLVARLRQLEGEGTLQGSVEGLAGSYVHMYLNRMLRSSHRLQEILIGNFLLRCYRSQLARAKKDLTASALVEA